ncbi:hypothetical protein NMY22_g1797 [Coprinellus aureogranulatus]|nr:hypothetical protein NMY22_g1797 [Coprinellus aureogranulatus]
MSGLHLLLRRPQRDPSQEAIERRDEETRLLMQGSERRDEEIRLLVEGRERRNSEISLLEEGCKRRDCELRLLVAGCERRDSEIRLLEEGCVRRDSKILSLAAGGEGKDSEIRSLEGEIDAQRSTTMDGVKKAMERTPPDLTPSQLQVAILKRRNGGLERSLVSREKLEALLSSALTHYGREIVEMRQELQSVEAEMGWEDGSDYGSKQNEDQSTGSWEVQVKQIQALCSQKEETIMELRDKLSECHARLRQASQPAAWKHGTRFDLWQWQPNFNHELPQSGRKQVSRYKRRISRNGLRRLKTHSACFRNSSTSTAPPLD